MLSVCALPIRRDRHFLVADRITEISLVDSINVNMTDEMFNKPAMPVNMIYGCMHIIHDFNSAS